MSSTLAKRLLSTVLAILISGAVLWWLLADGMSAALMEALGTASFVPLALGAILAILIQIIRAWRFAILLDGRLAFPSWTMIGIATKLVLFNFLLPFKLGELSFPLLMKKAYGTPFGQGTGILILCRLLDLGVVAAIIMLTAAWLLDPAIHGWSPSLVSVLGLVILMSPLVIANSLPWLQRLTRRWPRIAELESQMNHGAKMMRPIRQGTLVAVLTLLIWYTHALIAWLVALSIDAKFGVLPMAMASASSNLAFALPVSGVAGLGPPQAAWASMLHLAGHDWAPAITSALLCHGLLLATLSCFGLVFWIIESFRVKSSVHDHARTSPARCH